MKSQKIQPVIETSQSAQIKAKRQQSIASVLLSLFVVDNGGVWPRRYAKFFYFLTFSAISLQMKDFPRCQNRNLPNRETKTKSKTPLRLQKLSWIFSTAVVANAAQQSEKVRGYPSSWARCNSLPFFRWNSEKGRSRIPIRKFGCHAVLIGPSLELKTVAETTAFCKILHSQIQGNNLKRKEENYQRRVRQSEKMPLILFGNLCDYGILFWN